MANARAFKRTYNAAQLGLNAGSATTGVWATQFSAGVISLHKAAAATTSVVNIGIPPGPTGFGDDLAVSIIEMFYLVSTADLTNAPTVTLESLAFPGGAGTGIVAKTDITQVLTFAGVDTIGKTSTSGNHIAVVTVTTPLPLTDQKALYASFTMGEAATSVLDIFGIAVTYQSF